ncbi:MAG: response regulator [Acidimicrobiales bacterium]
MTTDAGLGVLIVDDDDVAAEGVLRGLRKHGFTGRALWVTDGATALEVLRGRHHETLAEPRVVLLDLNMPVLDGFGFLEQLRGEPMLHSTVVFVLTTSSDSGDMLRAYDDHVAGYMVKSAVGPQFARLARLLESYAAAVVWP